MIIVECTTSFGNGCEEPFRKRTQTSDMGNTYYALKNANIQEEAKILEEHFVEMPHSGELCVLWT